MSASSSEASGEINQPLIAAQPPNQPMRDNQGWFVGEPYALAFIAVQQMNAIEAHQLDEEEEEGEEEELVEAPEEDNGGSSEEELEEELLEEEEDPEEGFFGEGDEPKEMDLGPEDCPIKDDDDTLSDASTQFLEEKVLGSKYDHMKAKYKDRLWEMNQTI